jgi:isopenicillin-N epimerase
VDILEWTGTRDISAFLTIPDAIAFQEKYHWSDVRLNCHQLAYDTQLKIYQLTGRIPLNGDDPNSLLQMSASPLPESTDLEILKSRLYEEYHIEVPLIEWEGIKLIRYSFQAYNDEGDQQALLAALAELL